jgi:hypothetical protein
MKVATKMTARISAVVALIRQPDDGTAARRSGGFSSSHDFNSSSSKNLLDLLELRAAFL